MANHKSESTCRVLVSGGGSGGHAIPALTIARELRNRGVHVEIIGSAKGIERELFTNFEFPYYVISTGKLRRYFSWRHFIDPFLILLGILQSFSLIWRQIKPDVVFTTGGFVSVPPVLAAKLLGIPVLIHEQTVSVGLANRIAGRFARRVLLTFPGSAPFFKGNTLLTGMPVRSELKDVAPPLPAFFHPRKDFPLVFITGGAQGSLILNQTVFEILPDLLQFADIIHQTGHGQTGFTPQENQVGYISQPFFGDEMAAILQQADLLIGRSGAGTVVDCQICKTPAIFVPLPNATMDEQQKNAEYLAELGGAEILPQTELTGEKLMEMTRRLLTPELNQAMGKSLAAKREEMDGTEKIIGEILAAIE